MSSKSSSILQKVAQERTRGDFQKALKRLHEAIQKDPSDVDLFKEAVEVSLEVSDSIGAVDLFKDAYQRFPNHANDLWEFATSKLRSYNDPILASFLFEFAIKKRELETAHETLSSLRDQTINDLLKRARTKKQTLTSAMSGGAGFRTEITVNALSEAILCLKTKRFQKAVRLFLGVLDDKPVEHEVLLPFLLKLEKEYSKKGAITYGVGCAYLAAEKFSRGLPKVVAGVLQAPALAEEAISRLVGMQSRPNMPDDELDFSIARLHIISGAPQLAASRLQGLLAKGPSKASEVVDLLAPQVEEVGEDLTLHMLYLNAARMANRPEQSLKHARRLYKEEAHRAELLAWFEDKAQELSLSPEFQVAHGEMVLDEGMHERAVEIFRGVLAVSPQEQHTIAAALSRHGSNPHAKAMLDELSGEADRPGGADPNGLEIEHYGDKDDESGIEFNGNLSWPEAPAQAPEIEPPAAEPAPQPRANPASEPEPPPGIELSHSPFGNDAPPQAPVRRGGGWGGQSQPTRRRPATFQRRPLRSNSTAPPQPGPAAPSPAPAGPEQSYHVTLSYEESANRAPIEQHTGTPAHEPPAPESSPPPPPAPPILAHEAPAPSYAPVPPVQPPAPVPPVEAPQARQTAHEPPITLPASVEPEKPNGFHGAYKRFERCEMATAEIIDLIERAHCEGRWTEMKSLLGFRPKNIGEDNKRKFHLAGYYLDQGHALSSLIVLRTVNLHGLAREERRSFLLRIAMCYRELNRFDAAHTVYLRMMSEDPKFAQLEDIARINYQQYMDQIAGGVPILEKVTVV